VETIDAHTHIFPPELIKERSKVAARDSAFANIYGDKRSRMIDAAGLLEYMEIENIDASVVCGFPFQDRGLVEMENDYILEEGRKNKNIIPLTVVNIEDEECAINETERCFNRGARGVGEIALYGKGLGKEEMRKLGSVASIVEKNHSFLMIHINEQVGHVYNGKVPIDLIEVVRFIEAHRGIDIILSHLGGGLCFYEFMPEIKKAFVHVYYDMAAIPLIYSDEIYHFIEGFLSEKTLFGSDYPLLSIERYREGIRNMGEDRRRRILYANARRVFWK
jgi:predicted TIM-barrel fold metal-dependent hydrolase